MSGWFQSYCIQLLDKLENTGETEHELHIFTKYGQKLTASVVLRSEFLATDPEVRDRFPVVPDFLRNSESGMVSTRSRQYN
jgi:hypothetical protein